MVKITTQTTIGFDTFVRFDTSCVQTIVKLNEDELKSLKTQIDETLSMFSRVRSE